MLARGKGTGTRNMRCRDLVRASASYVSSREAAHGWRCPLLGSPVGHPSDRLGSVAATAPTQRRSPQSCCAHQPPSAQFRRRDSLYVTFWHRIAPKNFVGTRGPKRLKRSPPTKGAGGSRRAPYASPASGRPPPPAPDQPPGRWSAAKGGGDQRRRCQRERDSGRGVIPLSTPGRDSPNTTSQL
jgi:hypothetical protein